MLPSIGMLNHTNVNHSIVTQSTTKQNIIPAQKSYSRSAHEVIDGMTRNDIRVEKMRRRKQRAATEEGIVANENAEGFKGPKAARLEIMQQIGALIPWKAGLQLEGTVGRRKGSMRS